MINNSVYKGIFYTCIASLFWGLPQPLFFNEIKFRSVETDHQFPDTWFAQDLYAKNIPIYVDTKSLCKHRSKTWGTFDINFK